MASREPAGTRDQRREKDLSPKRQRPHPGKGEAVDIDENFAVSLGQDRDAVRAALTLPWSSGQAEGQITRLNLLKRAMYGRANLDLLRRRFLLAA